MSERAYRQSLPRPEGAVRLPEPEAAFLRLGQGELELVSSRQAIEEAFPPAARQLAEETGLPAHPAGVVAAVLLALGWEGDGRLRLLAIRRAAHLRRNPGEVAFPGGAIDPGERPDEAALREADEEVSLPPERVRLLAPLPAAGRISGAGEIAPVVGLVDGSPELLASADEVDEIFLLALDELLDPARYWEESWSLPGRPSWRMPFFDLGEDILWGASARILVTFLEALARLPEYARRGPRGPRGGVGG